VRFGAAMALGIACAGTGLKVKKYSETCTIIVNVIDESSYNSFMDFE
jgi:hypothetical protein